MKALKWAGAACMAVLLLVYPETALNASRQAMLTWAQSVAPALFPFMVLTPLLTCESAVRMYQKLFGRIMGPLFGLPGAFAPAMVIAMTAGSPAGATAAVRIAAQTGVGRGRLTRTAACVCGVGPAFLIGGIGTAMLRSPAAGGILLRAQLTAQLSLLLFCRWGEEGEPVKLQCGETSGGVRDAAVSLLAVCGYMMIFNTVAALIARILNSEIAGIAVLCLTDLPGGARALAETALPYEAKMILLGAMTGFGGLCINVQNLAFCCAVGVKAGKYLAIRMLSATICAAATAFFVRKSAVSIFNLPQPMAFSALIAGIFAALALISLRNTSFLNKRKSDNFHRKNRKNQEKPQHVVDGIG